MTLKTKIRFQDKFCSLLFLTIFFIPWVQAQTKVTWWAESNADRDPVFQKKLVDVFNSSQNEIELVMEFKENLNDILRTAMVAGEGPDIVETPGPSYVKEYQDAGLLQSMQTYSDNMVGKICYYLGLTMLGYLMGNSILLLKHTKR